MMHAKTTVVDGAWAIVGSANLDERSMELNEENVLGIADRDFARSLEEGIEADFARSQEILLEKWRKRPIIQRGLEAVAKALIEQY
jgi:cardiolipin synthase